MAISDGNRSFSYRSRNLFIYFKKITFFLSVLRDLIIYYVSMPTGVTITYMTNEKLVLVSSLTNMLDVFIINRSSSVSHGNSHMSYNSGV